jgi:glycosyltransferase involved in cell wall biosynthesis
MYIGVNAMQVRAAKSGVGQYIHALLESATHIAPDDRFLVYCNAANEPNYTYDTPNSSTRVWGLSGMPRPLRLSYEAAFLPGQLKADGIDVFHGASNFLPVRKACPYVVSIHDLSYHVHPERCPPVRRYYWYAMTRLTVAVADRILTISENSRRDIVRFFPEAESRIRVISLAAHKRFQKLAIRREESEVVRFEDRLKGRPYVLYVGTLEPGKNVARIVQAFDQIAAAHPEHVLVLAGDKGWLFESVFDAINEAAHKDRIFYVGHVSDAEAVHLYNFAEAFVFPSLYEGFGLPPLEAMACGCPVITSDRSSVPEVVGDAALMVHPEDMQEIASAIKRFL